MSAEPFGPEEIEAARTHPMGGETRWLATVDARDAEIGRLREVLAEALEVLRSNYPGIASRIESALEVPK